MGIAISRASHISISLRSFPYNPVDLMSLSINLFLLYRDVLKILLRLTSRGKVLDPLPWQDYFTHELYLEADSPDIARHHIYLIPPEAKGPLFVAHHGAGSSGLSFALFAFEVRKILPSSGVLSLDARGHGETTCRGENGNGSLRAAINMDLPSLSQDLINVISLTQVKMGWKRLPNMILIGPSLGGAVVTEVANNGVLGDSVLGYGVIDAVEGLLPNEAAWPLY